MTPEVQSLSSPVRHLGSDRTQRVLCVRTYLCVGVPLWYLPLLLLWRCSSRDPRNPVCSGSSCKPSRCQGCTVQQQGPARSPSCGAVFLHTPYMSRLIIATLFTAHGHSPSINTYRANLCVAISGTAERTRHPSYVHEPLVDPYTSFRPLSLSAPTPETDIFSMSHTHARTNTNCPTTHSWTEVKVRHPHHCQYPQTPDVPLSYTHRTII